MQTWIIYVIQATKRNQGSGPSAEQNERQALGRSPSYDEKNASIGLEEKNIRAASHSISACCAKSLHELLPALRCSREGKILSDGKKDVSSRCFFSAKAQFITGGSSHNLYPSTFQLPLLQSICSLWMNIYEHVPWFMIVSVLIFIFSYLFYMSAVSFFMIMLTKGIGDRRWGPANMCWILKWASAFELEGHGPDVCFMLHAVRLGLTKSSPAQGKWWRKPAYRLFINA